MAERPGGDRLRNDHRKREDTKVARPIYDFSDNAADTKTSFTKESSSIEFPDISEIHYLSSLFEVVARLQVQPELW